MAVALRGAAVVPVGNPTTGFTVVIDAAVAANDLLFLALTSRDSTGAGTLAVTDNDTGGNAWAKIGNSTDHKATLWYKRATSATAGKTVTVANAVGSSTGVLKAFSGAATGATPYTNIVVETNASADETHAGFTPTNANSMVCASVHNYANDNAVTSLSFATLGATTMTEKLSTGGSDCATAFGHAIQSGGPTATGNLTWAQTDGTTYSIVWAVSPLALTNYTLTADSGGVAITGTAANLEMGREVAGAAGSVSITGTAATTRKTSKVAADSGSLAITGSAAGVSKGRTLTADQGSVAISGTAATLAPTRRVSAATGAVSITGTAASLERGAVVSAAAGTVPVGGSAAAFGVGRVAIADPGSMSISGAAAVLERAAVLDASGGSVPISGAAAGLVSARTIGAAPGAVPIGGTVAALELKVLLQASSGAVPISGTAAAITRAALVQAQSGTVPITGSGATLVWSNSGHQLSAEPGTVAIIGATAGLVALRSLAASSGVVPIAGTSVTMTTGTSGPPFSYGGASGATFQGTDGDGVVISQRGPSEVELL